MSAIQSDRREQGVERLDGPFPAPKGRRRGVTVQGNYIPYVLILPAVVTLIGVLGYPLVRVIMLAFQNVNSYLRLAVPSLDKWIGFQGFGRVLSDSQFWSVVERSFLFTVEVVTISIALGLGFALVLNRVSPWAKIFVSTVMMFVWAVPALVTGTVFRWLFAGIGGVVDYIFYLFGGSGMRNHDWFANANEGLYVVVAIAVVWGALPFLVLGLNAAMTQVPRELVEAAKVDGANPAQQFRHVILPIIRPFLLLCTSLSFIWDFQVFAQIWALRQNSPEPGYWTVGVYLYEEGFTSSHYSTSSVISIAMILLMLVVLIAYIRQVVKIGGQG
ncbi:MAG TPA: sugar ABC transporter permease [Actinocrinis sp.]|uniref:carbohydrate ABC transporter permease n=1 Tax=Actinocrinis sp. TaxID=1920516 RepID=UPI002DDD6E29|nr:sugar ABC transporter permease [Actinocrinis sp.]HEV2343810.1 sugar ABC transporter permease [Actinocrinis sp.]